MCDYICTNCCLNETLEIVKSPTGINAVWNKDDNTVYYNSKIFNEEEKDLFFTKRQKQMNTNDCENHNTNYRGIPPNKVKEEHKDIYRAVRQSRIECCKNCPKFQEVK
jgi:hypothetical protein